jgi:hypothetical protein
MKNTTKTKSAAIKHARKNVSTLSIFGGQWRFTTYDATMNAWWESVPKQYHAATFNRAQALIDEAREFLNLPQVQYDGGAWTDYV